MKINLNKRKALSFMRAWVKEPLNYFLADQKITEASCCKYLGIIIRSDLSWADQVNYTVQKAWRALHFVMRTVKMGNKNTKSLAYTSLVRPILEYGAAWWDPYRECQVSALDRVQNKAVPLNHTSRFRQGHKTFKSITITPTFVTCYDPGQEVWIIFKLPFQVLAHSESGFPLVLCEQAGDEFCCNTSHA